MGGLEKGGSADRAKGLQKFLVTHPLVSVHTAVRTHPIITFAPFDMDRRLATGVAVEVVNRDEFQGTRA